MSRTVQVRRDAIGEARIVDEPLLPLGDGEIRLKVESFSVTANNVTYAVAGDSFGYWNFFPGYDGWGVVPMWGHALVEASNHPQIAVGERVYGYLPMAETLDVLPASVTEGGFTDSAAHRQPMSPIYNQYSRLAADPEHDPAREAERMIFGPLFKTGFLIESFMRREGWFGAGALVMSSASSKTSLGLASVARDRSPGVRRIGLTSAGNVGFVEATGLYDQVVAYGDIAGLAVQPSVFVDFAGDPAIVRAVHERCGEALKYSCQVGLTHIDSRAAPTADPLPGPPPKLFFAPDHAVAEINERGPKGFGEAVGTSWKRFLDDTDGALAIDQRSGLEAAREAFAAIVRNEADPSVGVVVRP